MDPALSRALDAFVAAARDAFADDLRCIALFGSAAEDQLRRSSDVNCVLVLARFSPAGAERLREPLALAWTTIRLQAMFLLETELVEAAAAFAVKFDDIARRRRVLYGEDLLARVKPAREAVITQLRQATLGLALRLREQFVDQGFPEERLVRAIADAAGPLRACAAALLEMEHQPAESARAALTAVMGELPALHEARTTGRLPAGVAGPTMLRLLEVAETLARRARELR